MSLGRALPLSLTLFSLCSLRSLSASLTVPRRANDAALPLRSAARFECVTRTELARDGALLARLAARDRRGDDVERLRRTLAECCSRGTCVRRSRAQHTKKSGKQGNVTATNNTNDKSNM